MTMPRQDPSVQAVLVGADKQEDAASGGKNEGRRRLEVVLTVTGGIATIVGAITGVLLWLGVKGPSPPPPAQATGFILRQPGIQIRLTPRVSGQIVGALPYQTKVFIVCTEKGDPVSGPGLRLPTRLWDCVRTDPTGSALGFVPDAWVDTGTTNSLAPTCR